MDIENVGDAQQAIGLFVAKIEEVTGQLVVAETLAQEAVSLAAVLDGSTGAGEAARAMAAAILQNVQDALGTSSVAGTTAQEYASQL